MKREMDHDHHGQRAEIRFLLVSSVAHIKGEAEPMGGIAGA